MNAEFHATQDGGPATILVVDDSMSNRRLLNITLGRFGHRVLEAENGRHAFEVLGDHREVDLILLDLLMPVMDGFEFLAARRLKPEVKAVPAIINSSLDDFESIARALDMGAYDYFTKPLSADDLKIVLPLKIRNAVSARRLMAESNRQNEIMRRELNMAALYQRFLLPKDVCLPGLEVAHLFEPCTKVGGDYFDFIEMDERHTGFVVADVSGHGVASAMTASIIKALLPGYLARQLSPAMAFTELNNDLLRLTQKDVFVTAFAGVYDSEQATLTWSLAGHPPPFFVRPGGVVEGLEDRSVFLGVFANDNPLVKFRDHQLTVAAGDRLALYTDGLTEAPDAGGGRYGQERLKRILRQGGDMGVHDLRESLWTDLNGFVAGEFPDDVAFILVDF